MSPRSNSRLRPLTALVAALSAAASLLVSGVACATQIPDSATAGPATPALPVREICPDVDAALQSSLGRVWDQVGQPGVVQVEMRVEGQRVTLIDTQGAWPEYRRAVRRAVVGLSCDSRSEGAQTVRFDVNFVGPDHASTIARVAHR